MSGKISNHNEMADEDVGLKDNSHKTPVGENMDNDVEKKSGLKGEMKLVNGIIKDDFENSNKNHEKEISSVDSESNVEKISEKMKMNNGFNPLSEPGKENKEISDDNSKEKINKVADDVKKEADSEKEESEKILNENKSIDEKPENGIDSIKPKDENPIIAPPKTDNSDNDCKTSSEKTQNTAETNKKEQSNAAERVESQKENCEKKDEKAAEDDENNDVIIISSTEGISKSNRDETNQKFDAKNVPQKSNKLQVGASQMVKSESQSSSNMSSSSSSSSTAPSFGDTSMTAFARLLHDLGVELVRQHVYKDLVEIQVSKDVQNKLNDREKEQLTKLEEFYAKQEIRNAPYNLKEYTVRCKCRVFASESKNVMRLHQEYGRIESGSVHVCCCCKEFKSRWPSHYITHMKTDHDMVGRLRKKMSPYRCSFCSYEAKNQLKIDTHMITCSKRFVLACNLQPLPADTDIPLKRRFIQTISYSSSQSRYSNYLGNSSSNSSGYTSIYNHNNTSFQSYYNQNNNRNLSDGSGRGMYNNMSNSNNSILSQQQQQAVKDARTGVSKMEICEICGSNIFSRAALLNHLQIMHKVKLNTARGSTEPIMSCDRCSARFWTYQGLAKHATMVHKSSTSASVLSNSVNTNSQSSMHGNMNRVPPICHICGDSQTFNPLNHMSTRHNITLLDMYQVKQCYICNKALKNGPNFQEHMVLYHRDIFANKDVLHTVLQALSAARHLKREESSQPNSPSNFNKYKKFNQPLTSTPISSHKAGMFSPGSASASGASKSMPIKRRNSQATSVQKPPEKEKKTSEQERIEMEKLYENLAGIGRPILRSMKQRMSSGSSTNTTSTSPTSATTSNKAASASTNSAPSSSIQSSSIKNSDSNINVYTNNNNNNNNTSFKNNFNNNNKNNSINTNTTSNINSYNNSINKSGVKSHNHTNINNSYNNNNSINNNSSNNNQSSTVKNPCLDKGGVYDPKSAKTQHQQPSSTSSSSATATEPEAKRARIEESVVISDSN